jgi:hypothetical protein
VPVVIAALCHGLERGRPAPEEASDGAAPAAVPAEEPRPTRGRAALVGAGVLGLTALLAAAIRLAPERGSLDVEVLQTRLHPGGSMVSQMDLLVHNRSAREVRPVVSVQRASWQPYPWHLESGPRLIGPGSAARYRADTDLVYQMLDLREGGQVVVTDADGGGRGTSRITPDPSFSNVGGAFNAEYRQSRLGEPVPWGWEFRPAAANPGVLQRSRTSDGRGAVELGVLAQPGGSWELARLSQTLVFPIGELRVPVAPPAAPVYVGDRLVTACGLEFDDGRHRLWVLFGPGPERSGSLGPGHAYETRFAAGGRWTEERVDLHRLYARLGWPVPPPRRLVRGDLELLTPLVTVSLIVGGRDRTEAEPIQGRLGPLTHVPGPGAVARRVRERVERRQEYAEARARVDRSRGGAPAAE